MRMRQVAAVALATTLGLIAPVPAVAVEPAGLARYELRVDIRSDGSGRASLEVILDPLAGELAIVPFPFAAVVAPTISGVPGIGLSTVAANGQTNLVFTLPPAARAPVAIRVTAEAPEIMSGTPTTGRSVRIGLLNSQPAPIHDLRLVVVFPEGLRGHAIHEALPRQGKAEIEPRAAFAEIDQRGGVRLQAASIAQGETALLRVELADASPSPGWLVIGLLLGVFYLVSFRDLVSPSEAPPQKREAP